MISMAPDPKMLNHMASLLYEIQTKFHPDLVYAFFAFLHDHKMEASNTTNTELANQKKERSKKQE